MTDFDRWRETRTIVKDAAHGHAYVYSCGGFIELVSSDCEQSELDIAYRVNGKGPQVRTLALAEWELWGQSIEASTSS